MKFSLAPAPTYFKPPPKVIDMNQSPDQEIEIEYAPEIPDDGKE